MKRIIAILFILLAFPAAAMADGPDDMSAPPCTPEAWVCPSPDATGPEPDPFPTDLSGPEDAPRAKPTKEQPVYFGGVIAAPTLPPALYTPL